MSRPGYSLGVPNSNISRRLSTHQGALTSENGTEAESSSMPLDDIISAVSIEWKELVSEDSNTLEVALSLMDNSSIGKAKYYSRFEGLKSELQEMLKLIVNGK
jgi:exocyst complex component 4